MPEASINLTAADIMTAPVITISSDASLADAADLILRRRIGCLPVLDADDRLLGLITDDSFFPTEKQVPYTHERHAWLLGGWLGDIDQLEETLHKLRDRPITETLIQREPVAPDTPLADLAKRLMQEQVHHVVVVEDGKVVGVVSRHDMAKLVLRD